VFRDLSNKYYNLLKDKNYDINHFNKDFEREMEKNYDFNNPDYKSFFRKIEYIFLLKMNSIEDKNIFNDSEIIERENNKIFNRTQNSNLNNTNKINNNYNKNSIKNKNENEKQAIIRDEIKLLYSPRKEELNRKQNEDEWAKIVNKDFNKFLLENEFNKQKEKSVKMQYSKILLDQIREKENLKKMESENERKYYQDVFLKNLKDEEKKEIEKMENYKKRCIENKQASMKELRGEKI